MYWPETIKKPEELRGFYWAPDYSFCGFAANTNIDQTFKSWQKIDK
jgi:hypothetical protein